MDIGKALKSEISRIARKELRAETKALKCSAGRDRKEIGLLKHRLEALEGYAKKLAQEPAARKQEPIPTPNMQSTMLRFSAKSFATQRHRLGLSASEMASLLGVSGQSVYYWEKGQSRPRDSQLAAISAVRKMGKREAAYRLSVIHG